MDNLDDIYWEEAEKAKRYKKGPARPKLIKYLDLANELADGLNKSLDNIERYLKTNGKPQHIVCAAIRAEDGDLLIGIRHYSADMILQMNARTDGKKFQHRMDDDQGFIDQDGNYYTRAEAYLIAKENGQIINPSACRDGELYSEGLY